MKRSVGALFSWASSTSLTTRAMVLSAAAAVTDTRSAPSPLTVPAKTLASGPLRTGVLSPVTGASSMALSPVTMTPSAGMRSPGRIRMTAPTASVSAFTSLVLPSASSSAVFGTKAVSDWMLARALPAATPSRSSPIRKSSTTVAASALGADDDGADRGDRHQHLDGERRAVACRHEGAAGNRARGRPAWRHRRPSARWPGKDGRRHRPRPGR